MIRKVFYLIALVLAASVDSQALTASVPQSATVPVIWDCGVGQGSQQFQDRQVVRFKMCGDGQYKINCLRQENVLMQQRGLSLRGNVTLRPNGVRSYAASVEMNLQSGVKPVIKASSRGTLKAHQDVGAYANNGSAFIFCAFSLQ